jgi:hypothetical protein
LRLAETLVLVWVLIRLSTRRTADACHRDGYPIIAALNIAG